MSSSTSFGNESFGNGNGNDNGGFTAQLPGFENLNDASQAPFDLDIFSNPISEPGNFQDQHNAQQLNQFGGMVEMNSMSFPHGFPLPQINESSHQDLVGQKEYNSAAAPQQQGFISPALISAPMVIASTPVSAASSGWLFDNFGLVNSQGSQALPASSQHGVTEYRAVYDANADASSDQGVVQQIPAYPASPGTASDSGFFEYLQLPDVATVQATERQVSGVPVDNQAQPPVKERATREPPAAVKLENSIKVKAAPKSKAKSATNGERRFVRRGKSKHPEIEKVIKKLQTAADKLNQRNDLKPAAHPNPPAASGLCFTSAQEAATANKITYWDPPTDDASIPNTQDEIEAWVVKVLAAIKNNEGCLRTNVDKDSSATVRRWGEGADYYPATALEAAAWKLVSIGCDVHQNGWLDAIPEPKLREDIYYSMCFTFEERMTLVIKVLEISKPTCEDLLKGNRFQEIVGCPQVVYERVWGNNNSNKNKLEMLNSLKPGSQTPASEKPGNFEKPANSKKSERLAKPEKRKRAAEGDEGTGDDFEMDAASLSAPCKKKRKISTSSTPTDGADVADSVVSVSEPEIDAPHETDNEVGVQSEEANTALSTIEPSTLPRTSSKAPTCSKRSIKEVEDEAEATRPVAKRAKAGSRAKAPANGKSKGKGKGKPKATPAVAGDDIEVEGPKHRKAAAKAPSSSQPARATRPPTSRKAPAGTVVVPESDVLAFDSISSG